MKRRTIREAAIEALKLSEKPLSSNEIYEVIVSNDLYRFNAENPKAIVNGEIRRHCVGIEFPTAKEIKDFQILIDGTFWIKDMEVPGQTTVSIKSEKIVRKDSESLKEIVSELKAIHSKHNEAFKKQILSQLKAIAPQTFEVFAKRLLEVYGFIDM